MSTGGSSAAAPARSWLNEISVARTAAASPSTRRRGSSMSASRIPIRMRLRAGNRAASHERS